MPIEIQKLIGEVAARNHCRIEASDPIFAVSTINRLMLDEVVEGLIVRVSAAITASRPRRVRWMFMQVGYWPKRSAHRLRRGRRRSLVTSTSRTSEVVK